MSSDFKRTLLNNSYSCALLFSFKNRSARAVCYEYRNAIDWLCNANLSSRVISSALTVNCRSRRLAMAMTTNRLEQFHFLISLVWLGERWDYLFFCLNLFCVCCCRMMGSPGPDVFVYMHMAAFFVGQHFILSHFEDIILGRSVLLVVETAQSTSY